MAEQPFTPDIEQIKAISAKFKALFQRMDAHILIMDDMIAQLEEDYRRSPLYQYRLNRAKRLLNNDDV
jgi:uncharacterized protein YdcH (DUF465 family)